MIEIFASRLTGFLRTDSPIIGFEIKLFEDSDDWQGCMEQLYAQLMGWDD